MGALTLSVVPAAEPVSLSDAKAHMRVDLSDDDTLISALVLASKNKVEDLTGRKLITQTWIWTRDSYPTIDRMLLPIAPASSVVSIVTTDINAVETIFAASNYLVDIKSEPNRIVLKQDILWPDPTDQLQEINGVAVTFVVGYGTSGSDVPENLLLAIKELALHFYENRELVAPLQLKQIPMGVMALLEPFRAWNRFGGASK